MATCPFGMMIPGLPFFNNFEQVDANKWITTVPYPETVEQVCFSLLPNFPLRDCSVVLYYTLPPGEAWNMLGTVSTIKPSAVFTTGWSEKPEFRGQVAVQIGLTIESLDFASNVDAKSAGDAIAERRSFALRIANDLYQYMASFTKSTPDGSLIIVPTNIIDKWLERYKRKFEKDPGFLYSADGR